MFACMTLTLLFLPMTARADEKAAEPPKTEIRQPAQDDNTSTTEAQKEGDAKPEAATEAPTAEPPAPTK